MKAMPTPRFVRQHMHAYGRIHHRCIKAANVHHTIVNKDRADVPTKGNIADSRLYGCAGPASDTLATVQFVCTQHLELADLLEIVQ
jgi:hypothetical protein